MSLLGRASIGLVGAFSCCVQATNERANTEVKAQAHVKGKEISGTFELVQSKYTANTEISGTVTGLYPSRKHGVQIHEKTPAGPGQIFNPFGKHHGGPWSAERKVGDLGNIQADDQGKGTYHISDPYVKISGPFAVIEKIISVHENPDDLGYGRNDESKKTGGVGALLATGLIVKH